MLRHLKMELKRQQALDQAAPQQVGLTPTTNNPIVNKHSQVSKGEPAPVGPKPKRVRGRRSSKPAMEKKRRARINQCLDILKSYVLNDSNNLVQLGIDATTRENQTEETIAKHILTSSGLINRHRGRKNTNKLEKADILELTVDYVRRLHLQRNELILNQHQSQAISKTTTQLTNPLSLNCLATSPKKLEPEAKMGRIVGSTQASILPSPPSSTSSSPQPLLAISGNIQLTRSHNPQPAQATIHSDVLDLSDSTKKNRLLVCPGGQQHQNQQHSLAAINQDNQRQGLDRVGATSSQANSLAQNWQNWNPQYYYYAQT